MLVKELGLPGLILWPLTSLYVSFLILRRMRLIRDPELAICLAGALAAFIPLPIEGFSGFLNGSRRHGGVLLVRDRRRRLLARRAGAGAGARADARRRGRRRVGRAGRSASRQVGRMLRLRLPRRSRRDDSVRERIGLLIGDRRGPIALLALCSILSGFAEAATIAMVGQLAASVVGGGHKATHNPVLSIVEPARQRRQTDPDRVRLLRAATALPDPAVAAAGADLRRSDGAASHRTVRRVQPRLLDGPVARARRKPAGGHDQPGLAGGQRRLRYDRADRRDAAVRRADGQRACC